MEVRLGPFKNTPNRCPECGCVEWHALVDGTNINTAEEAYECMTDDCDCVKLADDMPEDPNYVRFNHEWYTREEWNALEAAGQLPE